MKNTDLSVGLEVDPAERFTGPRFLRRTSWAVAVSGAAVAFAVAYRWGALAGLGFLIGTAWGLASFWGLAWITKALANPTHPDKRKAVLAGVYKLVLYALGTWLLWWERFPPLALVAGFSWLLVVLVLRAGGAMLVLKNMESNHKSVFLL